MNTEVSCEAGQYSNFTGLIMYHGVDGFVKDAYFILSDVDNYKISFNKGVWLDGCWGFGLFSGGTWLNGTWHGGTFSGGTWCNGVWHDGIWKNGTWVRGVWHGGVWDDGTWEGGVDLLGKIALKSPNLWKGQK